MRKGFLIVLAVVLVAALAAPAMAGMDATGFIRIKGYLGNFKNGSAPGGANPVLKKDAPDAAYVDQRFRAKLSFGEENVKAVWFSEIDYSGWGDASAGTKVSTADTGGLGAQRNTGAALSADRVNLETKNVYLWFKLPDTSLDFTVGMQNQTDAYAGLFYGAADMAGVFVNGKVEPVSYKLGWSKWYENNNMKADDMTLYVAEVNLAPTKDAKVGLNVYFWQDDTGKTQPQPTTELPFVASVPNKKRIYTPGVNATINAGPATLTGFALYQFGKIDFLDSTPDVNIKAFAADLRADLNLGPGKFFLEGLYISGGDNSAKDYKSIFTANDLEAASPGGAASFTRTDMVILLANADDINTGVSLVGSGGVANGGFKSPGAGGRGITHVAAGYTQKLGDKITGKIGAGYLAITKKQLSDTTVKGKGMGTEVNANVNYNIMKGLDFGLYAGYCWLGDWFKSTNAAVPDPDNVYDLHARLNYAF